MAKPFPSDLADRRALMVELRAQAPEVLAELNTLRNQFPNARLTYIKVGEIEHGERAEGGWEVPASFDRQLCEEQRLASVLDAEQKRKQVLARQRVKAKRRK